MKPKRPARRRHIPQRTCIGCRTVLAKKVLVRIVRTPDGVWIDPTGRLAGRGAYLHNQRSCWEQALWEGHGRKTAMPLASALKVTLSETDLERLKTYLEALPE
jgi:hypothetical protein